MESSHKDTNSWPKIDHKDQTGPSNVSTMTKNKGASRYRTKFNKAWITTFLFVHEVQGDAHSFYCTMCKRSVSCGHMGRHDMERHIGLATHKASMKAAKSQSTLSFASSPSPLDDQVCNYFNIVRGSIIMTLNLTYKFPPDHTCRTQSGSNAGTTQHTTCCSR